MTRKSAIAKVEELQEDAAQLHDYVRQSAETGTAAHEVEEAVFERVLRMGRRAMADFFDMQGDGDLGETVETPDGEQLKRLEPRRRRYLSIFGEFELKRVVYGAGERKKIQCVPLDARLNLPESKFSYLLQDWGQMMAAEQPFAQVPPLLSRILGLQQHVDSLERTSRSMASDADSFCWSHQAPPAEEEGEIVVQTGDGKGVPIRRPADAPPIARHERRRGPLPDRKKMATVGSVYTIDPYVRTPQDIVEALFRDPAEEDSQPSGGRPRPCHKHTYASLSWETSDGDQIDSQAAVFGWAEQQVEQRDPTGYKPRVCIMDGQDSLWEKYCISGDPRRYTEILDLLHVTPRLWTAARIFHGDQRKRTIQFVRQYVLKILEGKAPSVIRGLRRMATLRGLSAADRDKIEVICNYFHRHKHRMRYDEFLARGYPIASGVIEGACRHVVKDRLERAGMSWVKEGAQAMLLQRAIYTSGQWDDFVAHRIDNETERLYPYRSMIQQLEWSLSA